MLKTYEAKTQVNLSVRLPNGASAHVSFRPKTAGGSVYYTDNETMQAALERHPRFGKLFRLTYVETEKPEPAPEAEAPAEEEKAEVKSFRNNDDAKDYLAERFGISRSKLRRRADIEQAAAANGIVIEWKES